MITSPLRSIVGRGVEGGEGGESLSGSGRSSRVGVEGRRERALEALLGLMIRQFYTHYHLSLSLSIVTVTASLRMLQLREGKLTPCCRLE
jgi:hypothetical protein